MKIPVFRIFGNLFLVALIIFSFINENIYAQNNWTSLAQVTYKKEYDELLGIKVDKPIFSKELRKLEGQEIKLRGYIIPTEGFKSHKEFVFSAYPYASCFFCGKAGPETVVEIQAKKEILYTSEPIEIKGRLVLNDEDINRLMFLLKDVEKLR